MFSLSDTGGLSQVPDDGGTPMPFTTLAEEGEAHRLPRFLPGGRAILYKSMGRQSPEEKAVYAFDPDRNVQPRILDSETEGLYVEPGYLVYVRDENLMLQSFDADRLELTGKPREIVSNVQYDVNRAFLNLDLAANGTLVYQEVRRHPGVRFGWLDFRGKERRYGLPRYHGGKKPGGFEWAPIESRVHPGSETEFAMVP